MKEEIKYGWWIVCLIVLLLYGCGKIPEAVPAEHTEEDMPDTLATDFRFSYALNTNLEVRTDSVYLECLPVKGLFVSLRQGDRVVIAKLATYPGDSADVAWVKLAHSQEVQGWIPEDQLLEYFAPVDSVSHLIDMFRHTSLSYLLFVLALFIFLVLALAYRRRPFPVVFFRDIGSPYPALLCLLAACLGTLYETMQLFFPEVWKHFYFHPTLTPWRVPGVLSVFLGCLWGFLLVGIASLDDIFRRLVSGDAWRYLFALMAACVGCYGFFIQSVHFYIGYLLFLLFAAYTVSHLCRNTEMYRCGCCGARMSRKGVCPSCHAVNE
ncbi:MAG: hypothetical protein LIP08_10495 [Bacteroides sp.]|nr:hypothetical protein [Bacteroides sp.]